MPLAQSLFAQQPVSGATPLGAVCARDATAGSPAERTLLAASLLSPNSYSSLLRPIRRDDANELALTLSAHLKPDKCDGIVAPISMHAWYNSSKAHPDRDGAVWQGRGLTSSITGGMDGRVGRVSAALHPIAWVSENRAYSPTMRPSNATDFRDPLYGGGIDLPYRFGTHRYAAIDPGESYLRLDFRRTAVGLTTQSQQWGPAHFYPLTLGTEGPGFPRAFVEARRIPVGIGHATAHWLLGVLEASPFSGLPAGQRSRVASAFTASVSPKLFRGLEVGGARFFHVRKDSQALGWSTATLPFSGLLKSQSRDVVVGGFNQLASIFARLAPVGLGFEVYGELYREDHNANLRDLIGEPDHASAYLLGLRRAWTAREEIRTLTLEHANGRIAHLIQVRDQGAIYVHSTLTEGHTYRGQPLGSAALLGGAGAVISWSQIQNAWSRTATIEIRPSGQNGEGGNWNGRQSGAYVLEVEERRVLDHKLYGVKVYSQLGYGPLGTSSFAMSLSLSR